MAAQTTADDIAYVTALVRSSDRPRYYATLFAPAAVRADLFALYGFAAEIARVPDQVNEPGLGEIRLRWWLDALAEATSPGGAGSAPVLRAVADTIEKHRLPLAPFSDLIEARSADLYSDPPASTADLEGRIGETESVLFQMASIALAAAGPETADAAGHAGIAYGLARRLASFTSDGARGRIVIPADVLKQAKLSATDIFSVSPTVRVAGAVAATANIARRHLRLARKAMAGVPLSTDPAFLPLAIVEPLLRRVESLGPRIAVNDAKVSDFEALCRIGLARLTGLRQGSDRDPGG